MFVNKLASRKLWVAVGSVAVLAAVPNLDYVTSGGIAGAAIVYLAGQAWVDRTFIRRNPPQIRPANKEAANTDKMFQG